MVPKGQAIHRLACDDQLMSDPHTCAVSKYAIIKNWAGPPLNGWQHKVKHPCVLPASEA